MSPRSLTVAQGALFRPVPMLTHSGYLSPKTREPFLLVSTSVPTSVQEDDFKFEAGLVYMASSRPAWPK